MAEVKRARPDGNLPKRDVNDHRGGSKVVLVWLRWLYCMHRCIFSILNFLHPRFSLLVCIDSRYKSFTNLLNQQHPALVDDPLHTPVQLPHFANSAA
jgi:hypothetical protein